MATKINVDKDIRLAETLPAKFYKDENLFDISKKKIFLRSWHWIGDDTLLKEKNTIIPYNILPFSNWPRKGKRNICITFQKDCF